MTQGRLPDILAAKIERKDQLPCGCCGGRHVETVQELDSAEPPCTCRCCHRPWGEMFEADFPDLITIRGGVRVVTEAAMHEAIRRMEAEIAQLERGMAD
jgi:hypothetical protein